MKIKIATSQFKSIKNDFDANIKEYDVFYNDIY